jgi:ABC-type polysaccharide/polyol phosphate transport system ATPase subunit
MFDLKLNRVSKRYLVGEDIPRLGRNHRLRWPFLGRYSKEIWALRDVSFEVEAGESVGLIGNNGAGKSTILKLLSSITAPTTGEIAIRGRLSAVVEVSSGFHPELSGRENIYLQGCMLGMARADISRKVESIVEFAGVREYIDVPVKRYSSGMYVRLGFSIAAHLEPDILLIDEVLAVGDLAFQAKCLDRIERLRRSGRTIVLISHDLGAIQRLCDRALLLHQGQVVMSGSPEDTIVRYQEWAMSLPCQEDGQESGQLKSAECVGISFAASEEAEAVRTGYPMLARFAFQAHELLNDVVFHIFFYWPSGYLCAHLATGDSDRCLCLQPGCGGVEFRCPVLEIQPGLYRVDLLIESGGECIDRRERCAVLRVDPGKAAWGDFYIDATWRIMNSETRES